MRRSRLAADSPAGGPVRTPDGRYIVVRERLWRAANPNLSEDSRAVLVSQLMAARRAVRSALAAGEDEALSAARSRVHAVKVALGERGPPWWEGAPDYNRIMVVNSPYRDWWLSRGKAS